MRSILVVVILLMTVAVAACSTCYAVRVTNYAPQSIALVYFDEDIEVGENDTSPPAVSCRKVPEFLTFGYQLELSRSDRDVPVYKLPPVPVKNNMPKKFMSNPARLLYLELDQNRQPIVLFNMKLSDLTTKLIAHDETPQEKQQRLKDEQLSQGIKNQDLAEVNKALAEGASVIQPWVDRQNFHEDRRDIWAIYNLAMATENPEIINAVLNYKAPFRERVDRSALYHSYEVIVPNKSWHNIEPRYVSIPIADVLLSHGANPNYGVTIYFNWGANPELEKSPAMPRFARYKDAPFDRLIYTAVVNNNIEFVKILLKHGAETHFRLPASRTPPEWWNEGEWFLDWVNRTATDEMKQLFLKSKDVY